MFFLVGEQKRVRVRVASYVAGRGCACRYLQKKKKRRKRKKLVIHY